MAPLSTSGTAASFSGKLLQAAKMAAALMVAALALSVSGTAFAEPASSPAVHSRT
ncbi:hypothetical protein [Noviherbaspirillum aridicola]|uniref:hypothetical protein n=1 Tax=Noviherbaspirillum aridicola TaxID=2849687 RepID=UPI001C7E7201|nr:hypothetical protein [Noviherbaspirillum aridicola]